MKGTFKKALRLSSFGLLAVLTTQAYATGYRLPFQSPAVLAESGDAAIVTDASTNWYNSAGLTRLPQQLVLSATGISAHSKFSGSVFAPNAVSPTGPAVVFPRYAASGSSSSHTRTTLPAIHYALPIDCNWSVGLSIVPAWGFIEDYGNDSILRFNIQRIYTKTIQIAPSIAWKLNDQWSFGLGPDFHYMSALYRARVNTVVVSPPGPFNAGESTTRYTADNWGHGAHIGAMWQAMPNLRVGLNYRTKIVMDLDGYSAFDGRSANLPGVNYFESPDFGIRLTLPPVWSLGATYDVNPCWSVNANINYDQWSIIKNYYATGYAIVNATAGAFTENVTLPQQFRDAVEIGVGSHFQVNPNWLIRGSMKYVGTPTRDAYRDPLFPDGEKFGVQIGTRYMFNKCLGFDLVYGHVFIRTVDINARNPVTAATATGSSKGSIDFLGGSVIWNI